MELVPVDSADRKNYLLQTICSRTFFFHRDIKWCGATFDKLFWLRITHDDKATQQLEKTTSCDHAEGNINLPWRRPCVDPRTFGHLGTSWFPNNFVYDPAYNFLSMCTVVIGAGQRITWHCDVNAKRAQNNTHVDGLDLFTCFPAYLRTCLLYIRTGI